MRFLLCALVLLAFAGTANAAPPRVVVDGQEVAFPDAQPEVVSGRVMVPLRMVAARLGAPSVQWEGATRTVTITHEGRTIRLEVGRAWATTGRTSIPLDAPPVLRQGRVLVPLRFVGEALGASVAWQPRERTAVLSSRGQRVNE